MPARRTLALIARQESVDRLPTNCQILPLRPYLSVGEDRMLETRPENLLNDSDEMAIEGAVEDIVSNWWRDVSPSDAFTWKEVNLAECFSYGLGLVVRDMIKSARILNRAIADSGAEAVFTDVPLLDGPVPPYPYLSWVGSLLENQARNLNLSYRNLGPQSSPPRKPLQAAVARAYLYITAPRALARLRRERPLVAVGPHREFYLPIAKAWRHTSSSTIVAIPSRSPIRAAPRADLSVLPFEALLTRKDRVEMHNFIDTALKILESLPLRGPLEQEDLDLTPILQTHLTDRFRNELKILMAIGVAFDRGLDRAKQVVLVETGSAVSKAVLRYAQWKQIPVAILQHGVIAGASISRRTEGDRIAAWGPDDAEWFRANLDRPVSVEPTGCPRYDDIGKADIGSIRSVARVHRRSSIVMFASQPFLQDRALRSPWEQFEVLSMVLEAAQRSQDYVLLIKWHPSQRPEVLPLPKEKAASSVLQFHTENTWALINDSDVVLTFSSTVALEGMFLERPVIFLGSPDPESPFQPPEAGAGLRALRVDELVQLIEKLLKDSVFRKKILEGQRAYLAQHYAPLDGHAADRVVTFLKTT